MVRKTDFAVVAFDLDDEIFVIHIISFASSELNVYLSCRVQIVLLKADKVPIAILSKHSNFTNVISPDLVAKLAKYNKINNHTIDLLNSQQPPYRSIYSLILVKLEISKTYIKINLANSFIRSCKSFTSAQILIIQKFDSSLWLYFDYQGFNNLTIKNWYSLFLIDKSLNWLNWAKCYS